MKHGTFLSLVGVENKKLWKRLSTKIVALVLIAITIFSCVILKVYSNMSIKRYEKSNPSASTSQSSDWKDGMKKENQQLQTQIDAIKDDSPLSVKSELDSLKRTQADNQYRIDHDMAPNSDPHKTDFWGIMSEVGMWSIIALLVIIATSGLVAGEFTDNTMKTMISRPYSRNQLLSAKLIVTILFTLELFIVSFVLSFILILALFGANGIGATMLLWMGGKIVEMSGFAGTLFVLLLDFASALVFILFAFFIATVSRSRAASTGISIAVLFGSSMFVLLSSHFDWGKYVYLGDATFSTFLTKGAPFFGITFSFSIIYCLAWTVALIVASYFTFAKRDIN